MRPAGSLKEGGRGVSGSARGRRVRAAIGVAEIALAVLVIVGAGLLVRSFTMLTGRDVGFAPENLVTFNVQLVTLADDAARTNVAARLFERIAALPGVESAGGATGFPPVTPQRGTRFELDGRQLSPDDSGAFFIAATRGYFTALRTPVLRGRAFTANDAAGSEPVVVVNRTLADRLFPDEDPIGRRLRVINPEYSSDWRTIVGVVGDVQYRALEEDVQPTIYTPFAQTPFLWLYVMVRPTANPDALMASLRSVVRSVDPALTAAGIRQMEDVIASSTAAPRFNMLLVSGFALLALVLSAVGIYGVIAYSVAQRTHEIGVRMALGAATADVVRLVLREGLGMALAGILIGLGGAAMLTQLMQTMLFGVDARDPFTFGSGAAILFAVALLACYVPARRALRVDPMTALRAE
jgi:putative ABC transport system permease protein